MLFRSVISEQHLQIAPAYLTDFSECVSREMPVVVAQANCHRVLRATRVLFGLLECRKLSRMMPSALVAWWNRLELSTMHYN